MRTGSFFRLRCALGAALILTLLLAGAAYAKVEPLLEDWGFGGTVKSGLWSPLYLSVTSDSDFQGVLEVSADAGQRMRPLVVEPLMLVEDTPAQMWVYFRTPPTSSRNVSATFEWRIRDMDGRTVAQQRWRNPKIMPVMDTYVAAFNTAGAANAGLGALMDVESDVRVDVKFVTSALAPDRGIGYDSADVLIWMNPAPDRLSTLSQQEAILDYVRRGGHLVLTTAAEWQVMEKSFLGPILPARPTGVRTAGTCSALEPYGLDRVEDETIDLLTLEAPSGEVLMSEDGAPLIVRGRLGAGHVTLVGFDPTRAPFALMPDRKAFWAWLLNLHVPEREEQRFGMPTNASHALMLALNDFPNFKPINFFFVGAFLVIYVVLIGPVDYFVLKKFKKLHWTWVTFPTIAIASSLVAFLMLSSGRVSTFLANSAAIVDATAGEETLRGLTITTMLSPRQRDYSVTMEGATDWSLSPRQFDVGGGGGAFTSSTCYLLRDRKVIEDMQIRIWDAQTLEARWKANAPPLPFVRMAFDRNMASGEIVNETDRRIDDPFLIHRQRVVTLRGSVAAGKTWQFDNVSSTPLQDYARQILPSAFKMMHGHFGDPAMQRGDIHSTLQWLSLFPYAPSDNEEARPGMLKRLIQNDDRYSAVAYDLPATLALDRLDLGNDILMLYGLDEPFTRMNVASGNPDTWSRTLVRLRIPQ